jgi:hypothetical protein
MRYVELRRQIDNDATGCARWASPTLGPIRRAGLNSPYVVFVPTGAERASRDAPHSARCGSNVEGCQRRKPTRVRSQSDIANCFPGCSQTAQHHQRGRQSRCRAIRVSPNLLTLRARATTCAQVAILDRRLSARAARSGPRLGRRACSVGQAARQPRRTRPGRTLPHRMQHRSLLRGA